MGKTVRYKINDGSGHRLYVDVTLFVDIGQTGKQKPMRLLKIASKLNNNLKYKVLAKRLVKWRQMIIVLKPNLQVKFFVKNYIKVKPLDCHGAVICAHDNTNHEYSFKSADKIFLLKTTCSLSNNEITLPPISLSDLLAVNAQVEYFS